MPRAVTDDIYERLFEGDRRAAARLISVVESEPDRAGDVVRHIHHRTGRAHIIGITGSPGAGKSTLVDNLIDTLRGQGKTVGVIAVDPTSPFTGGALLGDRIRMQKRSTDKDVFVRSMGSRGHLGGLSSATADAIKVLDAMGKDVILVETVGVGQAEVDIVKTADTTVVVLVPGMGDEIQSIKAGIMEIADVFVVNKADRDGADKTVAEVEMVLMMGLGSEDPRKKATREAAETAHHARPTKAHAHAQAVMEEDTVHLSERRRAPRRATADAPDDEAGGDGDDDSPDDGAASKERFFEELLEVGIWYPPVLKTVAEKGKGTGPLLDKLARHFAWLQDSGERTVKQRERAERELVANMQGRILRELDEREHLSERFEVLVAAIVAREADPHSAAEELIRHFRGQTGAEPPSS